MSLDLSNFDPAPSLGIGSGAPLKFDVTGSTETYALIVEIDGVRQLAWDGTEFAIPFAGSSSRAAIAGGYRYTLRRSDGRWPLYPSIIARPLEPAGAEGVVTPDADTVPKRDGFGALQATSFVGPAGAAAALTAQGSNAVAITSGAAVNVYGGANADINLDSARDVIVDVGSATRRALAKVAGSTTGVFVPVGTSAQAVYPSGDLTGVDDAAAIAAARTAGRTIYLVPDAEYYTAARISTLGIRCVGGRACIRFGTGNGMAIVDGDVAIDYLDAVDGAPFSRLTPTPTVLLMNGQSNAAAAPPATAGYSAMNQFIGADLLGWDDDTGAFLQMVDGAANMRADVSTGDGPGGGQVLTRVARLIADATGDTVRTFALAYSSQNIDYFRSNSATPAYYTDGSQHATLNNYDLLAQEVAASTYDPQVIIYIQGEANAGTSQATYYTKLAELVADWATDYPLAHVIVVQTLGDSTVDGVRAAQAQVADENPHVHLVETYDMNDHTAYWGGVFGAHFTDYAGYEEVALRIFAKLQGETRADVPALSAARDAYAWQHYWLHKGSYTVGDDMGILNDLEAANKSLAQPPGAAPAAVTDADVGGRRWWEFDGATTTLSTAALGESGADWSMHALVEWTTYSPSRWVMLVNGTGGRIGLKIYSTNRYSVDYGGVDHVFSATVPPSGPHTVGLTIDSVNTVAKLYINGVFSESVAISGAQNATTPIFWVGSAFNAAGWYAGRIGCIALGTGVASAQQMRAAYKGTAIEYQLDDSLLEVDEDSDAADVRIALTGAVTLAFGKVVVIDDAATISALPLASTGIGRSIVIVNRTSGTLTVNRAGSDTIDGATSVNITTGNKATFLAVEAADWTVLT